MLIKAARRIQSKYHSMLMQKFMANKRYIKALETFQVIII